MNDEQKLEELLIAARRQDLKAKNELLYKLEAAKLPNYLLIKKQQNLAFFQTVILKASLEFVEESIHKKKKIEKNILNYYHKMVEKEWFIQFNSTAISIEQRLEQLLSLAKKGDEKARNEFFRILYRNLPTWLIKKKQEDKEAFREAFQNAAIKFLEDFIYGEKKVIKNILGYFYSMTKNDWLRGFNQKKNKGLDDFDLGKIEALLEKTNENEDSDFSTEQIKRFRALMKALDKIGIICETILMEVIGYGTKMNTLFEYMEYLNLKYNNTTPPEKEKAEDTKTEDTEKEKTENIEKENAEDPEKEDIKNLEYLEELNLKYSTKDSLKSKKYNCLQRLIKWFNKFYNKN